MKSQIAEQTPVLNIQETGAFAKIVKTPHLVEPPQIDIMRPHRDISDKGDKRGRV